MRRLFPLSLVGLLLLFPAFAETEIPVKIKAETLRYYEDTDMVEATGSVEVEFKEVRIHADRLLMDSVSNVATAEGNVVLSAKNYSANSDSVTYDASREVTDFKGFTSQIQTQKLAGKLYLSAGSLADLGTKMLGQEGTVTTCDEPPPHYFMRAQKITYYPEDRIEGWNAVTYVGELPVMWLPYYLYDLKEQRKKNWVFGHNNVEGDYMKTAWAYPGGLFLYDYTEKKGWGTGIDTSYSTALGLGTLYLYFMDEKDTRLTDRVEKLTFRRSLDQYTDLQMNHSYMSTYLIPSGRLAQTSFGLNLNRNNIARWNLGLSVVDDRMGQTQKNSLSFNQSLGRSSFSYSNNYDFSRSDPQWMQNSQNFSLRGPLWSDRVNFSSNISYYHRVNRPGDSGEEKAEPRIELAGSEPNFSWAYRQNWFVDLRQDLSPGTPRYEFLEKQPEIEISPRALDLKLFNLSSTFGYGYYREVKYVPQLLGKRDFSAQRYRTTLRANKSVPLALGTVMTLGAGLDQFLYGPGDQLYAYSESGSLQTNLFSFFRNDLSYRKGSTDGNSPFFFDKLGTRYHDATERMTFYYLNKFSWSFEGGRNWQTDKWFDVMTHLVVAPDPRLRWTIDTGWDIENTIYKDLNTRLSLIPNDVFSLDFSANQDLNQGQLRYGSVLYNFVLLPGEPNQTNLRVGQVYDPAEKDFKVRDIMVTRDLHCWEMKFTYSDYRKEFSFSFNLKAMPGEPVGFAPGRGFYYDGFERELGKLKPEGAVTRY
jgi:hypothetical protein